jgi:MFS family permease
MRNKGFMIIIVALLGMLLAIPSTSHARGHYYGWYGAGAFAGGVLLGTVIARPWYYEPAPVYVYPVPSVVYTVPSPVYVPNQVYAYPDQAFTSKASSGAPPGQWVEVPGLSVNGKWVPPHKAWVPNSP